MCGIVGWIASKEDKEKQQYVIERMMHSIKHRGPDDEGVYSNGNVAIGFKRLSIIDVSGGHQPIYSEDRNIVTFVNGEIYNYIEIWDELLKKGHKFSTKSDAEVVVHLYEDYGIDFVSKINGMFAIALYDSRYELLYLIRDRIGIKPLYYAFNNGDLLFASEIKAILASGLIRVEPDIDIIPSYLMSMYIPAPYTFYKGVKKLHAGNFLRYHRGNIEIYPYWDCNRIELSDNTSIEEIAEKTEWLIRDSVRLQLRSDVPLGVYLSGGVDSSTVTAISSQLLNGPLNTFTVGFEGAEIDELQYAKTVADSLGAIHREIFVKAEDFIEYIPQIAWFIDEPLADSGLLPNHLINMLAAKTVKVVLSGTGGDELFAGYTHYLPNQKEQFYLSIPMLLRKWILEPVAVKLSIEFGEKMRRTSLWNLSRERFHLERFTNFSYPELSRFINNYADKVDPLMLQGEYYNKFQQDDLLNRALYTDIKTYLADDLLFLLDSISMASSIEGRVPFLDHRLVEYALSIPGDIKIQKGELKGLLKMIGVRYVPSEVIYRRKMGFCSPLPVWFRGRISDYIRNIIMNGITVKEGLWDKETLRWIFDSKDRIEKYAYKIYAILMVELVWRFHVERTFSECPQVSMKDML